MNDAKRLKIRNAALREHRKYLATTLAKMLKFQMSTTKIESLDVQMGIILPKEKYLEMLP